MMLRYVPTGKEQQILHQLKEGNPVMILGLPGSGKSTLARYIGIQMIKEGHIPIILAPRQYYKQPEIKQIVDEDGNVFHVPLVPIGALTDNEKSLILQIVQLAYSKNHLFKELVNSISSISDKVEYLKTLSRAVQDVLNELGIDIDENSVLDDLKSALNEESLEVIKKIAPAILTGISIFKGISAIGSLWKAGRTLYIHHQESNVKAQASDFLFIIDDYADYPIDEKNTLARLLHDLSELKSKIIVVYRLPVHELISEEDISLFNFNPPEYAKKILSGYSLFRTNDQIIYQEPTLDIMKFYEILNANNLELPLETAEKLEQITAGLIGIAVMLAQVFKESPEEMSKVISENLSDIPRRHRYYPIDEVKRDSSQVIYNLQNIYLANELIYRKLRERNFMLIPLLLTPLRRSHVDKIYARIQKGDPKIGFYKEFIIQRKINIGGYDPKTELYIPAGTDFVYNLNELYIHMQTFLPQLLAKNKDIKEEISELSEILLEVFTDSIYFSEIEIFNIYSLSELINKFNLNVSPSKIISAGIFVMNSQSAIMYETTRNIIQFISKLKLNSLDDNTKFKLLTFIWQYSEGMNLNPYWLHTDLEVFSIFDTISQGFSIRTLKEKGKAIMLMILLSRINFIKKITTIPLSGENIDQLEDKVVDEINTIHKLTQVFSGSSPFDEYAKAEVYLNLGELYIFSNIALKDSALEGKKLLLKAARALEYILNNNKSKEIEEFLKLVFNANVTKEELEQLKHVRILGTLRLAYYYLAMASLKLNEIPKAQKFAEEALAYSVKESKKSQRAIKDWLITKNLALRIEIINRGLDKKTLKQILSMTKTLYDHLRLIPPESIMTMTSEILFAKYYIEKVLAEPINNYISDECINKIKHLELILKELFTHEYHEVLEYIYILSREYNKALKLIKKQEEITLHEAILEVIAQLKTNQPIEVPVWDILEYLKYTRDNFEYRTIQNILKALKEDNKEKLEKELIKLYFLEV